MANKKKTNNNELDVILAQLKNTYSSEIDDIDGDTLDTSSTEQDEELNKILNEIFASEESVSVSDDKDEQYVEPSDNATSFESPTPEEDEPVIEEKGEETNCEPIRGKTDVDQVDDVLNLMFGHQIAENDDNSSTISDESDVQETITEAREYIDENAEASPLLILSATEDEDTATETSETIEVEDEDTATETSETIEIEDEDTVAETSETIEVEDEDTVAEVSETIEIEDEDSIIDEIKDDLIITDDFLSDELVEEEIIIEEIEPEPEPEPILILSPDEYTYDPLQVGLPRLKKPSSKQTEAEESVINKESKIKIAQKSNKDFDNNDISLLVNFGYDSEIEAEVGSEVTQRVLFEEDEEFIPEKTHTPFGFCGKELSSRKQIDGIRAKYKTNKRNLIIMLSVVSVLSLILLANTVSFEFFSNKISAYPLSLVSELALMVVIGLIICKSLVKGWIGMVRFEPNRYVPLAYVYSIYIIYALISFTIFIADHSSIVSYDMLLIGFCISLYAVVTLLSDLLNCIKEAAAFDVIASTNKLYTAERKKTFGERKSDNTSPVAFMIKEGGLINGYFRKNTTYKPPVNLIFLLGVIPVISLTLAFIVGFVTNSAMKGVATMFLTIILSSPVSFIFIPSLFEYLVSLINNKSKVAFIGSEAVEEYAEAEALVFSDNVAISIDQYNIILPEESKDHESNKTMLGIAYEIFNYLGGPLTEVIAEDPTLSHTQKHHEITVNSISDNGLDIYYSSTLNVLFGDADYMRDHGINVKTSTKLTAATKSENTSVVYMAFDGVPRLGFIISCRVNQSFKSILKKAEENNFKACVETYEPYINNKFIERIRSKEQVEFKILKPQSCDPNKQKRSEMCDGSIVSVNSAKNIVTAIGGCPDIVKQRRKNALIDKVVALSGVMLSIALAIIACFNDALTILGWIDSHLSILLIMITVLGILPGMISSFLFKNKKDIRHQSSNGDQNSNERKA